jgi:predicted RNA methylase
MNGSVSAIRRDLVRKVRQVGVIGMLRHATAKAFGSLKNIGGRNSGEFDSFDLLHGTDTTRPMTVGALDIPNDKLQHSNGYQAVGAQDFADLMRRLSIPHQDFVFIDLGSGKGRALLMASRFPFKKIIGVELSSALHAIALRNLEIYKSDSQACHTIECFCQDASEFELPQENLVLFLYNPFGRDVMDKVERKVSKSLQRFPREIYVAYVNPVHREVWERSDNFCVIGAESTYVIYQGKTGHRSVSDIRSDQNQPCSSGRQQW